MVTNERAASHVRVLVVDDNAAFREAASSVVDSTPGFTLTAVAESGADAVRMAAELRPDVILMDVRMSGMSGIEAARLIAGECPETLLVLMSAWADVDLPSSARSCGAAESVHKRDLKPHTLRELWIRHGGGARGTHTRPN